MKKKKTSAIKEIKDLEKTIHGFIDKAMKDENLDLDELIKVSEEKIEDEEKLEDVKMQYFIMLALQDDDFFRNIFYLMPFEILEWFVPRIILISRIEELGLNE